MAFSKPYFSSTLRKLGLLSVAEKLRFVSQKIKYGGINRKFLKSHPKIVFPPPYYIYETYKLRYDEYWLDGLETAKEIVDRMEKEPHWPAGPVSMLDWGCGPGRVVRHLPTLLPEGSNIYGADQNPLYIQWCRRHLKRIRFSKTGIHPPFEYPGESLDAIISISVLTHLSAAHQESWIRELARVLKVHGLLFITTQGEAFISRLTEKEQLLFKEDKVVIRETKKEGNRLFSAFQPPSYIRKILDGKFKIIEFNPGLPGKTASQDSWLLEKNGS